MNKDEAIEAVAEAMRSAYGQHTEDEIVPWAKAGMPQKAAWHACAKAAIAAIRPYHFEEAAGKADDAAASCELQADRAAKTGEGEKAEELRAAAFWSRWIATTIRAAK